MRERERERERERAHNSPEALKHPQQLGYWSVLLKGKRGKGGNKEGNRRKMKKKEEEREER